MNKFVRLSNKTWAWMPRGTRMRRMMRICGWYYQVVLGYRHRDASLWSFGYSD